MSNNTSEGNIGNQTKLVSAGSPSTFNFLIAAGKTKQVLDSNIFLSGSIPDYKNFVNSTLPIQDQIRARGGIFWQATGNSLPTQKNTISKNAFFISASPKIISLEDDPENTDIFSETSQQLTLTANKDLFKFNPGNPLVQTKTYNAEYWKTLILGPPTPPTLAPTIKTSVSRAPINRNPITAEVRQAVYAQQNPTRQTITPAARTVPVYTPPIPSL